MDEQTPRFPRLLAASTVVAYVLVAFAVCFAIPALAGRLAEHFVMADGVTFTLIALGWLALALACAAALAKLPNRPEAARWLLLFVLLPGWGIALNHEMIERCKVDCPGGTYRVLASPEV